MDKKSYIMQTTLKKLGGIKMKLEKSEKHMMFSTTQIPDIFF